MLIKLKLCPLCNADENYLLFSFADWKLVAKQMNKHTDTALKTCCFENIWFVDFYFLLLCNEFCWVVVIFFLSLLKDCLVVRQWVVMTKTKTTTQQRGGEAIPKFCDDFSQKKM